MLSFVRKRLTLANVALVAALLLATSGGAYAASKYVISSTKQISPKVIKQLRGKTGEQGLAGPKGETGPAGAKGETGPAGAKGEAGTAGESVTVKTLANGSSCAEGGAELSNKSGKALACNGKSAGGTIKNQATESGGWSTTISTEKYAGGTEEFYPGYASITFPIPMTLEQQKHLAVHYITLNDDTTECPTDETPEPGNLCIYEQAEAPEGGLVFYGEILGQFLPDKSGPTTITGYMFPLINEAKPLGYAAGSWALTAEE